MKCREQDAGRKTHCIGCKHSITVPQTLPSVPVAAAMVQPAPQARQIAAATPNPAPIAPPASARMASNNRKILLFGVLGALGCLAGWVAGELFLWGALPVSKEAGGSLASKPALPVLAGTSVPAAPAPPPILAENLSFTRLAEAAPPPAITSRSSESPPAPAAPPVLANIMGKAPAPPPAEFAQRLELAGGKSGDVQVTLIWFNVNDLDLHCIDPSGEEIFYAHRRSRSGGALDVDMNANGPSTSRPVENIYWPQGKAPQGKYRVYINHYANHGGFDPTDYKVSVLAGGVRKEYTGKISNRQPKRLICEFDASPASGPELLLSVSPEAIVNQGGTNQIKVRLSRGNVPGPVTVRLEGNLNGISPGEFTILANQSEAAVDIAADANAIPGERVLNFKASAGTLTADATCRLTIRESDSELQVAASPQLVVYPGEKNQLKVRVARANHTGPINLRLDGDVRGVSPRNFTLGAGESEASLEIAADASTPLGSRTLQLVAGAGTATANTSFLFTVGERPPALRLAVSPHLVVPPGGENQLQIRVARVNVDMPVQIRIEGNLDRIASKNVSLAAAEDEASLEIQAAPEAVTGQRTLTVHASAGALQTSETFLLVVPENSPNLRLAVPKEIQLDQKGQNGLPLRILREGITDEVRVKLEGDLSGVSPREFNIPANRSEFEITLRTEDAAPGTRKILVAASGGGLHVEEPLRLIVIEPAAPVAPQWSWWLVIVIGLWTTLLALGLSMSLVVGQNWYLSRPWLSPFELAVLAAGSLAAGIVAGGVGQSLYSLLNLVQIIPQIGFLAGWLLLGGLLGRGVVFFIPNLNSWRAATAGGCGGFVGGLVFIGVSFVGDMAGRFTGAAILGCAIGLMVALVETAFRRVWVEVVYSSGEVCTVNLGATPVYIGGNSRSCTIWVAGAPGKALKLWEQDGQIYCLDVVAEKTYPVSPGYRHPLKNALVTVCSHGRGARVPPAPRQPIPIPTPVPRLATVAQQPPPVAAHVVPVPRPLQAAPAMALPAAAPPVAQQLPRLPVKQDASGQVAESCPVCGDIATGIRGRRRCSNCLSTF
jgi:hypothetical protein